MKPAKIHWETMGIHAADVTRGYRTALDRVATMTITRGALQLMEYIPVQGRDSGAMTVKTWSEDGTVMVLMNSWAGMPRDMPESLRNDLIKQYVTMRLRRQI